MMEITYQHDGTDMSKDITDVKDLKKLPDLLFHILWPSPHNIS